MEEKGILKLSGEWEFYWKKFYSSEDFLSKNIQAEYQTIPSAWNRNRIDNEFLERDGYATYRVKVKLDKTYRSLSMKIGIILTSFDLYINSKKVLSAGKTGISPDEAKPDINSYLVSFPADTKDLEIILHISNYSHYDSGPSFPIFLGVTEDIYREREKNIILTFLLFGSIFITGLYHLFIFLYRHKESYILVFSCFCFVISLRTLLTGENYLYRFTFIPYAVLYKLYLISTYLSISFSANFISALYNRYFSNFVITWLNRLSLLVILYVLIFPIRYASLSFPYFEGVLIIFCFYALYTLIRSAFGGIAGAGTFLLGTFILVVSIMHDILRNGNVIHSDLTLVPLGMLGFIFSQAVMLAKKFTKAFYQVEELSYTLSDKTRELEEQNEKLRTIDKIKDEFLANTSHELRTPLNGIIGITESLMDNNSGELSLSAKNNLKIIHHSGKRLYNIINDILDYSKI
ncbi:MAG: hypothetical protein KDK45_10010, partial [Leptospiraceae bacterium]|nr:hypothetical protein [Leptospiraceae bacterium]